MASIPKQFSKKDIEAVIEEASIKVSKPLELYLIGGCAMTFRGIKPATKDADALFEDKLGRHRFFEALKEVGFKELFPGLNYSETKGMDVLERDGLGFDLFAYRVFGGLCLSPSMKKRAQKHAVYGNVSVFLASLEDVYLFKAITNRKYPRDFEDLVPIAQAGVDWDVVYSGYAEQVKGRGCEESLLNKMNWLVKEGYSNPFGRKVLRKFVEK
ncbi:MAG: hypothetical protein WC408_00075 [Candidatus Micrarchaeia archaeon]|jgi:hypothetical protein